MTSIGLSRMEDLIGTDLTEMIELPTSGVSFFQTNQVTTTPNYKGVTGATALRTYIFGRDGVYAIKLGAQGDTSFGDGMHQNISTRIVTNAEPNNADPEGLIPGFTSYKVHFTTSLGPDTTIRQRQIDAVSAIS